MSAEQIQESSKRSLSKEGWCSFRSPTLANDILLAAAYFGAPVCCPGLPMISVLRPHEREAARENTTSSIYGRTAFPLHTDMAHWPLPPRYMLMRASTPVPGLPTILVDSHKLRLDPISREYCRRASWMVTGVRQPFLCSMDFDHRGRRGIRWDTCTMSPYGQIAKSIHATLSAAFQELLDDASIPMDWSFSDEVLIIDNWRMLHMRPCIPESAMHRTLERVLVMENEVV